MSSLAWFVAPSRLRGGMRRWSVAALSCGVLLVPAGSALADDMPGMANGMACPHAAGEGPDALAAAGPNEPTGPARAPSESPIAPVAGAPSAPASTPAAKPPAEASRPATRATQPATEVSKAATQVSRPATRVSTPATQVVTQRAATTAPQVVPAPAVTQTTVHPIVSEPVRSAPAVTRRVHHPRAKRPAPPQRTARRSLAHRLDRFDPRLTRSATGAARHTVVSATARPGAAAGTVTAGLVLLGVLGLVGIGGVAVLARRRRGAGGARVLDGPHGPATPAAADLLVEAELHEMISEARARALLCGHDAAEAPDERDAPATR